MRRERGEPHPDAPAGWDEQYTRTPFDGIRRMTAWLRQRGYAVNHKRVSRLLRQMGLEAIYPKPPKPRLSQPAGSVSQRYPYLLRVVAVVRPDQVWSTDSYLPPDAARISLSGGDP
jgi:putative transposase